MVSFKSDACRARVRCAKLSADDTWCMAYGSLFCLEISVSKQLQTANALETSVCLRDSQAGVVHCSNRWRSVSDCQTNAVLDLHGLLDKTFAYQLVIAACNCIMGDSLIT